ncbi:MAG: hypothetical protein PHE61_08800, partial [Candidatus Omnitrophica bacterium]|nr:hypothetical protein [Candidatus Omnitrophota bacterium]
MDPARISRILGKYKNLAGLGIGEDGKVQPDKEFYREVLVYALEVYDNLMAEANERLDRYVDRLKHLNKVPSPYDESNPNHPRLAKWGEVKVSLAINQLGSERLGVDLIASKAIKRLVDYFLILTNGPADADPNRVLSIIEAYYEDMRSPVGFVTLDGLLGESMEKSHLNALFVKELVRRAKLIYALFLFGEDIARYTHHLQNSRVETRDVIRDEIELHDRIREMHMDPKAEEAVRFIVDNLLRHGLIRKFVDILVPELERIYPAEARQEVTFHGRKREAEFFLKSLPERFCDHTQAVMPDLQKFLEPRVEMETNLAGTEDEDERASLRKSLGDLDKQLADVLQSANKFTRFGPEDTQAAEVISVENLLASEKLAAFEKEKDIASLFREGKIAFEIFAAGKATRLGEGAMCRVDFWRLVDKYNERRARLLTRLEDAVQGKSLMLADEFAIILSDLTSEAKNKRFALTKKAMKAVKAKFEGTYKNTGIVEKTAKLLEMLRDFAEKEEFVVPSHAKRGVTLGQRYIRELSDYILSRYGEEARKKVKLIIHVSTETFKLSRDVTSSVEMEVNTDWVENNFYKFTPDNVLFIRQPELPGYRLTEEGAYAVDLTSKNYPYNHGYATMQAGWEGEAYTLDRNGKRNYLDRTAVGEIIKLGAEILKTGRINDSTAYSDTVDKDSGAKYSVTTVDEDILRAARYLVKQEGYDIVVELVANPDGQKGGLGLQAVDQTTGRKVNFLLEGLNAGTEDWKKRLNEISAGAPDKKVGIPYNAFRLVYNAESFRSFLHQEGLPISIRMRDGRFYLEPPTGDITQIKGAKVAFIMKAGNEIHDFKAPHDILEAIEYFGKQDLNGATKDLSQQGKSLGEKRSPVEDVIASFAKQSVAISGPVGVAFDAIRELGASLGERVYSLKSRVQSETARFSLSTVRHRLLALALRIF